MVEQLDAAHCRGEAKRMREKAQTETNPALRDEYLKVAECFETLADEIDTLKKQLKLRAN